MKGMSALLLGLVIGFANVPAKGAVDKPNIIYIRSDELAYFDPGFMGNQEIQTPNLDQMAAEGMIFGNILAAKYLEILARLTALAEQTDTPCQTGTFTTTEFLERDRRAKSGKRDQATTEKKPWDRRKVD